MGTSASVSRLISDYEEKFLAKHFVLDTSARFAGMCGCSKGQDRVTNCILACVFLAYRISIYSSCHRSINILYTQSPVHHLCAPPYAMHGQAIPTLNPMP